MPSDQDTKADELDLIVDDATAKDESVDDTQDTLLEGEGESDTVLDLEKESEQTVDKLSPAEEQAQRQEDAWMLKVTSGKAKVEDAPSWLQGRLNNKLDVVAKTPDTEAVIRKVLDKERSDATFKELQSTIPKLTTAQANELKERYKALRPAGKVAALQASLDAMGLSQDLSESEERRIAKGNMSLPRSGQPSVRNSVQPKSIGGVPADTITDDAKWNEMIRQGNQG